MIDLNEIEILQVAVVHEERARKYYERQASRHPGDPAGDLFSFLAGEEEGHIRKLNAKFGVPKFEAGWEEKYLPFLIDLERLAWEEGVDAEATKGPEAVRKGLLIAKKAESHAIDFYRRAAGVVEDRNTKGLLSELESEERIHLTKIERYLKELQG
ncbi:MAG TPA: ferritin family protein [Candidatus Deferrimicrobiaceae bacterium]|jgi:rubrerythrin